MSRKSYIRVLRCVPLVLLRLRDDSMLPLVASFGSIRTLRDVCGDLLWTCESVGRQLRGSLLSLIRIVLDGLVIVAGKEERCT